MSSGTLRAAVVVSIALCACAASRPPGPRFSAPSTDADPAPFRPRPGERPAADGGRPLVLVESSGESQARALGLRFVRALLDADSETLRTLFPSEVLRIAAGQRVPRERLLEVCLTSAQQMRFQPGQRIEDAIDLPTLRVTPVVRARELALPGVALSDVILFIPVRRPGGGSGPAFTELPCISPIVVRPGPEPLIVAVGR
jgi:hypothetical protein